MELQIFATREDVDLCSDKENEYFVVRHGDINVYTSFNFQHAFIFWQGYCAALENIKE